MTRRDKAGKEEEERHMADGINCCPGISTQGKYYILLFLCILIVIAVTLSITITFLNGKDNSLDGKPHILLVIADDMGHNDIGYYNNQSDISTPHLDQLAREGVRLDRYYGQSICSPARAALFTGRYPYRYGLQGARPILYGALKGLPLNEVIMPQILKKTGYYNYLVGKWHLGYSKWDYTPIKRGFDYFFGMYGGFADYRTHLAAEPDSPDVQVFDLHEHHKKDIRSDGTVEETEQASIDLIKSTWLHHSEKLFTDKAVEIIRNHDSKEHGPMFLTVSYMNPHSPLDPLEEDIDRVPDSVDNTIREKFSALMVGMDMGVRQLTEALKARDMYDNTIIIFTGDNGGAVQGSDQSKSLGGTNSPLRGAKWTIWEGGVKVPAFVRGPGIVPGVVSEELFHISDWLPTIAGMVGAEVKQNLDGFDQSGILTGTANNTDRKDLVLELDPAYQQAAYIKDNFKLILGDPAPKPYNGIYAPLEGDEVRYPDLDDPDSFANFNKDLKEKLTAYITKSDTDKSFDFRDLPEAIGPFEHSSIKLYDLDNDPSETDDLFTKSERFKARAKDMYDHLAVQSQELADLIFYIGDNQDKTSSVKTLTIPGGLTDWTGTEMGKWTPWLQDDTESK